jgi:hypothetical protein
MMHFLVPILEAIDSLTKNNGTWSVVQNKFNEKVNIQTFNFEEGFANSLINLMPGSIFDEDEIPLAKSNNLLTANYSIASNNIPKYDIDDFSIPSFAFSETRVFSQTEVDAIKNSHAEEIQQINNANLILMNQKNAEIEQLINQMKILHNQQIDKLQSECQNYINQINLKHSDICDTQVEMMRDYRVSTKIMLDESRETIGILTEKLATVEAINSQQLAEKDATIKKHLDLLEILKEQHTSVTRTSIVNSTDTSSSRESSAHRSNRGTGILGLGASGSQLGPEQAFSKVKIHDNVTMYPSYSNIKNILLKNNSNNNNNIIMQCK